MDYVKFISLKLVRIILSCLKERNGAVLPRSQLKARKSLFLFLLSFIVFEKLIKVAGDHTVVKLSQLVGTSAVKTLEAIVGG